MLVFFAKGLTEIRHAPGAVGEVTHQYLLSLAQPIVSSACSRSGYTDRVPYLVFLCTQAGVISAHPTVADIFAIFLACPHAMTQIAILTAIKAAGLTGKVQIQRNLITQLTKYF